VQPTKVSNTKVAACSVSHPTEASSATYARSQELLENYKSFPKRSDFNMGTALPPNETGDACTFCFGVGKKFGETPTPKYIIVQLIDIMPGEFWIPGDEQLLRHPWLLKQSGTVCEWTVTVNDYNFAMRWYAGQEAIFVRNFATAKSIYESSGHEPCLLEYANQNSIPSGVQAFGGRIKISWSTEGLTF